MIGCGQIVDVFLYVCLQLINTKDLQLMMFFKSVLSEPSAFNDPPV